jgi:hypothetical protein
MAIIIVRHHHQVYPLLSSWLESRTRVSLVVKEKLKWTPPKNLPTEKKRECQVGDAFSLFLTLKVK